MDSDIIVFREEPHVYEVRGEIWRSVTQVIASVLGNPYAAVPESVLREARERGKRVDRAIQYYNEGDLDWSSIHEPDKPWIASYIEWQEATGFKPDTGLAQKMVLIRDLKIAGTPDMPGTLYGRPALIDIKAVAGINLKPLEAQTAGYCLGLGEKRDRYGLQLRPGKMAKPIPCENPNDYAAFRAICLLDAWRDGRC